MSFYVSRKGMPMKLGERLHHAVAACTLCLLLGYVLFAPVYFPSVSPLLYDDARVLELGMLFAVAILAAFSSWRGRACALLAVPPGWARFTLAALGVLALLSALGARFPLLALEEVALMWLLCLLALLLAALSGAYRDWVDRGLAAAFAGSALSFGVVFGVAYAASSQVRQPFEWVSPFVSFDNVRHFSQYQAYTLPLLVIPLTAFALPRMWRAAAFFIAAQWWALQFAVGTRAVWLAFAVAVAGVWLFARDESRTWLKWQAGTLLGGALLYLAFLTFVSTAVPGLASVAQRGLGSNGRFALWRSALAMIRESPWLGVGPMHYSFRNFEIAAHPHNSWLQIAAEYGLPAAFMVSLLVLQLLRRGIGYCKHARSPRDREINVALLAALLSGLADSLVSGNTIMPHSQVALALVSGWLLGRNLTVSGSAPGISAQSGSSWGRLALTISVLAAVSVLSWEAARYFGHLYATGFEIPAYAHPRFWGQGHWPVR